MGKIIYQLEIEHIFAKTLFGDDDIKTALNAAGITKEMRGNKMPLYQNEQAVSALQNGPVVFQESVKNSGFGIVRHEGAASGGNQFGKNAFLRDQIDLIIDPATGYTGDAQKYALLDLFAWTQKLARGDVRGSDGTPLGVMGNTPFSAVLESAWEARDNKITDYNNLSAGRKASFDQFQQSLDGTIVSDQVMRAEAVEKLATQLQQDGYVTPDQKTKIIDALGDGSPVEVQNAIIMASAYSTSQAGIFINRDESVAQVLTAGLTSEVDPITTIAKFNERLVQMQDTVAEWRKNASSFLPEIPQVSENAQDVAVRSLNNINLTAVSVGGGVAADAVEYLNVSYDALKKGVFETIGIVADVVVKADNGNWDGEKEMAA